MEKSKFFLICDKLHRLGYKDDGKNFREYIKNFLIPFTEPVEESVNGVEYLIVAGFFNIFFIYLIYFCPSTGKYFYYGTHRDSDTIIYKDNFPIGETEFSTFDEAVEYIYNSLKDIYEK